MSGRARTATAAAPAGLRRGLVAYERVGVVGMFRLPSYQPDGNNHCWHGDNPAEPCYGKVEITDEQCTEDYSDCYDIHQCEGHALCHTMSWWDGYKPSPHPRDQGQAPIEDDR